MPFLDPGEIRLSHTVQSFALATRDSSGYSVREKRPDDDHPHGFNPPRSLFLIYITRTNNVLDVRHMYDEQIEDIGVAEIDLFDLARAPEETEYHVGYDFEDLIWMGPCYVTYVIDLPEFDFNWGRDIGDDPLVFRRFKIGGAGPFDLNYSFFNAKKFKIRDMWAIRCTNYSKTDEEGTDIVYASRKKYSIDINLIEPTIRNRRSIKTILDPDGQNQGPPV